MTSNLLVPMVCLNSKPTVLRLPHSPWKKYVSGECDPDKLGPKDAPLPESPQTSVYLTGTGKDRLSHIVTDFNTGQSSHCQWRHRERRGTFRYNQPQRLCPSDTIPLPPPLSPYLSSCPLCTRRQSPFQTHFLPPTSFPMVPGPQTL